MNTPSAATHKHLFNPLYVLGYKMAALKMSILAFFFKYRPTPRSGTTCVIWMKGTPISYKSDNAYLIKPIYKLQIFVCHNFNVVFCIEKSRLAKNCILLETWLSKLRFWSLSNKTSVWSTVKTVCISYFVSNFMYNSGNGIIQERALWHALDFIYVGLINIVV